MTGCSYTLQNRDIRESSTSASTTNDRRDTYRKTKGDHICVLCGDTYTENE